MALKAANKKGRMKRDKEGYVDIIGGAFDSSNSQGAFYSSEGVAELLKEGSILARRLGRAQLYSELGHPSQESMSDKQYRARLLRIKEKEYCNHIKSVTLDTEMWRSVPGLERGSIATVLKVKPFGPHGHIIADAIETPSINLAYSIRSFVNNQFKNGRINKKVIDIVTYDNVGSQGMPTANKYDTPSVECLFEMDVDKYELQELSLEYQSNGNESLQEEVDLLIDRIVQSERTGVGLEDSSLDLINVGNRPIWTCL
jgi:hypothetical protein